MTKLTDRSDIIDPDEAKDYHDFPEEFKASGYMPLTNFGGIEIQIAPDNEHARYKIGDSVSKWRSIFECNPGDPDSGVGIFDDNSEFLDFNQFEK